MSVASFWDSLPFEPDPFQVQAVEAVERGESVVVSAPTGSGKTLIAEAAIRLAFDRGARAFYTTPLKALSNQKYGDFSEVYGSAQVGLLTGDNSINGEAPIVIMTTEVLRNMIYSKSAALGGLEVVVLDEVHYLQDRFRGAVWEEVIIHAPRSIQLVALSATVSNAPQFAQWVENRRGPTRLIEEQHRPVPLESGYLVKDRFDEQLPILFPMFIDGRPNQDVKRMLAQRKGRRGRFVTPRRTETCRFLKQQGMLPAIYFVFSRAGCDSAAEQLSRSHLRMTTAAEKQSIRTIASDRTSHLSPEELSVLGYERWLTNLAEGVAAHHAGLVPAFKEVVEELFSQALIRVVFATETLALGINMPAKTVVLDTMSKYTGDGHELLRPGDYTQLMGRAGRRGIDQEGFGVVPFSRYVSFERVAAIAAAGSHPIRSSFRPTYNMTVNLIANYGEDDAEKLLRSSFAQFQRERKLSTLRRGIRRTEKRLTEAEADQHCQLGDVSEYARLMGEGTAAPGQRHLRQGSVVDVPRGRWEGRNVVIQRWGKGEERILIVGVEGSLARVRIKELPKGSSYRGQLDLPAPFRPKSPQYRNRLGTLLDDFFPTSDDLLDANGPLRDHPVHDCPDRELHLKAHRRVMRLQRDLARQARAATRESDGLVENMRAVRALLGDWNYVNGWRLTDGGQQLRFLYNELDLLLAESIREGLFDGLEPSELAALTSAFVYEARREPSGSGGWPTPSLEKSGMQIATLSKQLAEAETEHRLPLSRVPDPGFAHVIYWWAEGVGLEDVIGDDELAAGDFVRTSRQLLDLLRQIRDASKPLASAAQRAISAIDRGVVSAGGLK